MTKARTILGAGKQDLKAAQLYIRIGQFCDQAANNIKKYGDDFTSKNHVATSVDEIQNNHNQQLTRNSWATLTVICYANAILLGAEAEGCRGFAEHLIRYTKIDESWLSKHFFASPDLLLFLALRAEELEPEKSADLSKRAAALFPDQFKVFNNETGDYIREGMLNQVREFLVDRINVKSDLSTLARHCETQISNLSLYLEHQNTLDTCQTKTENIAVLADIEHLQTILHPDSEAKDINVGAGFDINKKYQNLVGQANAARDAKDLDQAIKFYTIAIALQPKKSEAYLSRAKAYQNLQDYAAALKDIDQYIILALEESGGYRLRAAINKKLGKEEEAIEDLIIASILEKDTNSLAQAYRDHAAMHEKKGNKIKMCDDIILACKLAPENSKALAEAYLARGRVEKGYGENHLSTNSINDYIVRAAEIDPTITFSNNELMGFCSNSCSVSNKTKLAVRTHLLRQVAESKQPDTQLFTADMLGLLELFANDKTATADPRSVTNFLNCAIKPIFAIPRSEPPAIKNPVKVLLNLTKICTDPVLSQQILWEALLACFAANKTTLVGWCLNNELSKQTFFGTDYTKEIMELLKQKIDAAKGVHMAEHTKNILEKDSKLADTLHKKLKARGISGLENHLNGVKVGESKHVSDTIVGAPVAKTDDHRPKRIGINNDDGL